MRLTTLCEIKITNSKILWARNVLQQLLPWTFEIRDDAVHFECPAGHIEVSFIEEGDPELDDDKWNLSVADLNIPIIGLAEVVKFVKYVLMNSKYLHPHDDKPS